MKLILTVRLRDHNGTTRQIGRMSMTFEDAWASYGGPAMQPAYAHRWTAHDQYMPGSPAQLYAEWEIVPDCEAKVEIE